MSSASGAAGTSASSGAQGQRPNSPAVNDDPGGSSASTGLNGASGTNPPPDDSSGAIANPEAKRYADEAAQYRKQLRDAETELKKFKDAQLSDAQKLERDYTESQAKNLEYETKFQRQALRLAAYDLRDSLAIGDIRAALATLQFEHGHELKFTADGEPENLSDLLSQVVKDHPALSSSAAQPGGQQQQRQPAAPSAGATNPGRQASPNAGGLSVDIISAMSNRERITHWPQIQEWLNQNPDAAREWADRSKPR